MAASVREKSVELQGSTPGRVRVYGYTVLTSGTAAFIITPGNNNERIESPITSIGLRRIDCWNITSRGEDANDIVVEPTYSTSTDNETLVVSATADQTYDWWVEGEYVGQ